MKTGEVITVSIEADMLFSAFTLQVSDGDTYEFYSDKNQRWKDWFISSSPDGFFNLFAWMAGLRVKGVKCFCLCGCYNNDISTAFAIGSYRKNDVKTNGHLSFFANDAPKHYNNNEGAIEMTITAIKTAEAS